MMAKSTVASKIYPLLIPRPVDPHEGWRLFPVFRGATAGVQDLSCHASVLLPRHCPHPPHQHREEELLLLLSGQVDLVLPQAPDRQGNTRHRLQAGELVYYPRHFAHTLQAQGSSPAHYLMFKWHTAGRKNSRGLGFGRFDLSPSGTEPAGAAGLCIREILTGPTAYLKQLACHCSTLAPHAGYAPHTDAHDVALVVLDGQVETLGQRATPYHVIFYAAGEPHGLHNPGAKAARYLVVEFHARKPLWRGPAASALRWMARNLVHPQHSIRKTISLLRARNHDAPARHSGKAESGNALLHAGHKK
jgi:quercetin dioxygenase-like cupin family protein